MDVNNQFYPEKYINIFKILNKYKNKNELQEKIRSLENIFGYEKKIF